MKQWNWPRIADDNRLATLASPERISRYFSINGVFTPLFVRFRPGGIECTGRLETGTAQTVRIVVKAVVDSSGPADVPLRWDWALAPGGARIGRDVDPVARRLLQTLAGREPELIALWNLPNSNWNALERELSATKAFRRVPPDLSAAVKRGGFDVLRLGIGLRSHCLQDCQFCPLRGDRVGPSQWTDDVKFVEEMCQTIIDPARRKGIPAEVRIEADDLAGHPYLNRIVERIFKSTGAGIHMVMPPNRLSFSAIASRIFGLPGVEMISTTLFGATSGTHDVVSRTRGSFVQVIRALNNLRRTNLVRIGLKILILRDNLAELPSMLDIGAHFGAEMVIQYPVADCDAHHALLVPLIPHLDDVRKALDAVSSRVIAQGTRIDDMPLCAISQSLRDFHSKSQIKVTNRNYPMTRTCLQCRLRDVCVRVPQAYLTAHGEDGLFPTDAVQLGRN